jgi:rhodanese-related sulfurtransferase
MSYQDLHPSEVAALRAEGELTVFDTRDAASYSAGHMDGAEPVSDAAVRHLIQSRQRQRPILVYCYRGNSSRDVCRLIAGLGFGRVYNLVGGWQGWQRFIQTGPAVATSPVLAAWLMQHGYPSDNIHARIDNGMSPLMLAALKGDATMLEELLALGADPNHVNDDDHHALWFACVHGDPRGVSRLIARGANVDNQNVNGATCAIYAASTGKLEILKRLVEAGADLKKATSAGYSVMESASTLPVLKYLRSFMDRSATCMQAA